MTRTWIAIAGAALLAAAAAAPVPDVGCCPATDETPAELEHRAARLDPDDACEVLREGWGHGAGGDGCPD